MTTIVSPSRTSREKLWSTAFEPKLLCTSRKTIISQQRQRPERIQHQNQLGREHHRLGGSAPDTLGAPPHPQPLHAPDEGHRKPEGCALHQAKPDVLEPVKELESLDELHAG